MSDERKRIADLFGVIATAAAEICMLMGGSMPATGGQIAPDSDLDDPRGWGDEVVKKSPKRWTGQSYTGRRMSECPPEFLDAVAEFNDWAAGEDEKKAAGNGPDSEKHVKYARYSRTRAARARGWAQRLRNGWTRPERSDAPPPAAGAPRSGGFDDSAPPAGGFADNPFGGEPPPSGDSDW